MKLALKECNTGTNEPCAICGEMMETEIPLDMFLANSYEPVCRRCAEKYSPDLVELKDYFYENLMLTKIS